MNEEMLLKLIVHAGNAKSNAFEAWQNYQDGLFEDGEKLFKKAKEEMLLAHSYQTDLISMEASGEKVEKTVILIHAQDHIMTAMLGIDMIEQIIKSEKRIIALLDKEDEKK